MIPSHALVLTAGLGTRLRPLTYVRAKPAIPIAGEPLVRRIARWLAGNGVTDLVLNLHHRPETVTAVVGDGSDLGVRVRYSWEQPVLLGSAGGPRQALSILGADTFVIVNGDTLTDANVRAVADAHAAARALVTLALVPNREPERYGGVVIDADLRVTGFAPRGRAAGGSYHFIGVQIAQAEAFRDLPAAQPASSVGGVYDEWIARRPGSIRGHVCQASFWDVGTVVDYWTTSQALLAADGRDECPPGRDVAIDASARITRSIIWDRVQIGAHSVLDECIVTDGVEVPAGARYRRSALVRADGHRPVLGERLDGDLLVSPLDH